MPEGIKYHIIRADKDGCPAIPNLTFDDPAEAAKASRKLSLEMGEKLMVKLILNDKWKTREKLRFLHEEYRSLPWVGQEWWETAPARAIHKDHFAHPSKEKPGWIAYTKNAEDGMKDKQTVVRPGSYLKTYFERIMDHYGCSERRLVEQFMLAFGPIEVKFASTAEEIISVYDRGPPTCMNGAKRWAGDGRNPAWVYAYGDLQVAYLGDLTKASARVLVWPEKKIFSRVYGDIARLTNGLERLGYKWGAPIGAKISRLKLRDVKFDPNRGPPVHCFVAPYIDKKNQAGGGHLNVIDKEDYLEICEEGTLGSHHCGLADGYSGQYVPRADEYPTFTCDRCGIPGFRELPTVYTDEECDDQESWCGRCCKAAAIRDGYSGEWFTKGIDWVIVDGANWTKHYADMYAGECEATGNLTNSGNLINVHFADGKIKKVNSYWANENGLFQSGISRKYYLGDQKVLIHGLDGRKYAGKPELKYHAFQCDSCHLPWMIQDRTQSDQLDLDGKSRLLCPNCADGKPKVKPSASQLLYNEINFLNQAQAFAPGNPFRIR